jgi:hypothetical protein
VQFADAFTQITLDLTEAHACRQFDGFLDENLACETETQQFGQITLDLTEAHAWRQFDGFLDENLACETKTQQFGHLFSGISCTGPPPNYSGTR